MPEIIEAELSYKITGIGFKVQKELGRFCREKQYADKFEALLKEQGLLYNREYSIKGTGNIVDFIIDNKVIVDLKAKPFITKDDYFQMQRYIQASNVQLGLIMNFRSFYLHPKRVINLKYQVVNSQYSLHSNVNS
jgi:GxxExxY protein